MLNPKITLVLLNQFSFSNTTWCLYVFFFIYIYTCRYFLSKFGKILSYVLQWMNSEVYFTHDYYFLYFVGGNSRGSPCPSAFCECGIVPPPMALVGFYRWWAVKDASIQLLHGQSWKTQAQLSEADTILDESFGELFDQSNLNALVGRISFLSTRRFFMTFLTLQGTTSSHTGQY